MSEENPYIGNGKEKFDGDMVEALIDVDKLIRLYAEHGFETDQGKRKLKLKIGKNRKGPDQYENTHYVAVDNWHPDNYIPPGPIYTGGQTSDYQEPEKEKKKPEAFSAYVPPGNKPETFEDDVPF